MHFSSIQLVHADSLCLFQILHASSHSITGGRPVSLVSASVSAYLQCLEEVLVWLLGAEERLAQMPPIGDTTPALKQQFHHLEVSFVCFIYQFLVSVKKLLVHQ